MSDSEDVAVAAAAIITAVAGSQQDRCLRRPGGLVRLDLGKAQPCPRQK